jgi:hypothetical protein
MTGPGKDFNGSRPKRAASRFERDVADYAAARGLPWDRAPLRGARDLLDITGSAAAGFLVGCKGITRGKDIKQRLSEAMEQGRQAVNNWHRLKIRPPGTPAEVVPVQIMQRSGYPTAKAYAVMEYDDFLTVVSRVTLAEAQVAHYRDLVAEDPQDPAQD